jgi:hypothetical protein
MKISFYSLAFVILFSAISYGQVDTMRLLEVGSVTAPGAITNWYFEDLNGDSIKEIILTTANSVNIYSGSTFSPIWSQSGFTNPTDLNFADINNDGLIDFSVKDTSHIYLIDPHHSSTIWTSPMLDSTYKCYMEGDRNDDGWVDLFVANQQYYASRETVYVKFYDGPQYLLSNELIFTVSGYLYYGEEHINNLYFAPITNNSNTYDFLIITSNIKYAFWGPSGQYYLTYTGKTYLVDPIQIDTLYSYECGITTDFEETQILDSNYCGSLTSIISNYYPTRRYITKYSAANYTSNIIYYPDGDFISYFIGEIISSNEGIEICFNEDDYYLYLLSFPDLDTIWYARFYRPDNYLNWMAKFIYTAGIDMNNISYVVCRELNTNSYGFYNGENGSEKWFIPYCNRTLNGAANIHLNQTNYLYSLNADTIHFYALAPYVDINNPEITPTAFFLAPNYPNPFNASTMIEYGLPESGPVKVDIYDILGRKIQTLVDETQSAGYQQVVWNGEYSPSGTYFYRIQAGEKSLTQKCLLLK